MGVGEFRRQVLARAAIAGAGRIAGLGHEAADDAVEDDAVEEMLARQLLHPGDGLGGQIGAKLDHHPAIVEIHIEGVLEIGGLGASAAGEAGGEDGGGDGSFHHDATPLPS